jgi:pyrroloquinoline quinone (PQQ) biosynthesis protein C
MRASPTSAGVWWMIAHRRYPFAYLGALYLFEGVTPTVTAFVKEKLKAKGFTRKSLEYVEFHSTEDAKHAVQYLTSEVATKYPEATESIKYGFECFRAVYPIPLWHAAFGRAQSSVSKQEVS